MKDFIAASLNPDQSVDGLLLKSVVHLYFGVNHLMNTALNEKNTVFKFSENSEKFILGKRNMCILQLLLQYSLYVYKIFYFGTSKLMFLKLYSTER